MNAQAVVQIVSLVLDVLKQLEASGALKHDHTLTPLLAKARADVRADLREPPGGEEKKGGYRV